MLHTASSKFAIVDAVSTMSIVAPAIPLVRTFCKACREALQSHGSICVQRSLALLLCVFWVGGNLLHAANDEFATRLQAGKNEASQGDFSAAMADLKAAVSLDPDSAEGWYQFGLLLGQIADFRGAEAAFRRAIKLRPSNAQAHYNLALTLIADPRSRLDWPGAITELEAALQYQPNYAEALNLLGAGLTTTGKVDEAIPELQSAIRLSPSLAVAHFNLAIALQQKDRLEEAVKEYQLAISAKGGYPEASSALGKLLFQLGRATAADQELVRALRQNPDLEDAHYVRSKVLRSLDRKREAAIELEQFKDLSQRVPDAAQSASLSNHGLELASKGDLEGAASSLREAIALKPDYGVPHYNLGLILADMGKMPGAAEELTKAISLLPGHARPWFDLGRVLKQEGNGQAALAAMGWAARLSPTDPAILAELKSLRTAVDPSPEHANSPPPTQPDVGATADTASAHIAFAALLSSRGDDIGATGELLRSLSLQPSDLLGRKAIANSYARLGDHSRAILEYYKLLLSLPEDADLHIALGKVLLQQGNAQEAAFEFRTALGYRPQSPEALAALKQAEKAVKPN